MKRLLPLLVIVAFASFAPAADPWLSLPGGEGIGKGKHVVLVSGDEEYRSEEALPQLAKILSKHHGFQCTVLFAIDPKDGALNPNVNDNIPGLEALKTADLMVIFTRFRNLPNDQMKHVVDYVNSGKPIVGLRTATHAFNLNGSQYQDFHWANKDGGFGRKVLGETWVAHHGIHGKEGTRGRFAEGQEKHPILKGIKDGEIFGTTDVYTVKLPLPDDSKPLVLGEVTETLKDDSKAVSGKKNDPMMPVAWVKSYEVAGGKGGLVFTTTMGASQDLQWEATRRMIVNGCLWALGMDAQIPEKTNVDIVGEFKPTPFRFRKKIDWTIDNKMKSFIASNDLSGSVAVVGRKNGPVYFEAAGDADIAVKKPMAKDTHFLIASMTKPITALGIMILADEGKLSPDDPVEKHIPAFKGQKVKVGNELNDPKRPITLRDLLTHTAGLPNYPAACADIYQKRNKTLEQTTEIIAKEPLVFEPGTKWSYCNPGIDTLGRVIEVVSGEAYHEFLQKRVFDPLGMKQTTFYPTADQLANTATIYGKKDGKLVSGTNVLLNFPQDAKHPVPAGGLYSTAGDIAKLCQAMLGKGALGGKRIVSEKNFLEMTQTQTGDIKTGFTDGMSFGYGFAVVKEPKGVTEMLSPGTFGHGGAFGTQYWIDPKQDLFVILMIARTGLSNGDASEMRKSLQTLAVEAIKK